MKIPIILITLEDGEKLLQAGQKNQKISLILNMEDEVEKKENLDVEFWINPTNLKSYDFLLEFRRQMKEFDTVSFTPKYKFRNLFNSTDKEFQK